MARKVFFSFHYDRDVIRVSRVRNSNIVSANYDKTPFLDHADWETLQRQGDSEIKKWIDNQLIGSTVTCVLIGWQTDSRPWIHYEIEQSILRKNAILGIYIHNMKNFQGNTDLAGFNPLAKHKIGHRNLDDIAPTFDWELHDGYQNFGAWIEKAIKNFSSINHFRG